MITATEARLLMQQTEKVINDRLQLIEVEIKKACYMRQSATEYSIQPEWGEPLKAKLVKNGFDIDLSNPVKIQIRW